MMTLPSMKQLEAAEEVFDRLLAMGIPYALMTKIRCMWWFGDIQKEKQAQ